MNFLKLASLLWLLVAGVCTAQIKVEKSYPAYTLFRVECVVPADFNYKELEWSVSPANEKAFLSISVEPDQSLRVTGVPGHTYRLQCSAVWGKRDEAGVITYTPGCMKVYTADVTIKPGFDSPPDDDQADDNDNNDDSDQDNNPPPVVNNASVLLIEESAARPLEVAALIRNMSFLSLIHI